MSLTTAPSRRSDREGFLAVLRASKSPRGVATITPAAGRSANAVRFRLQYLIESRASRVGTDPVHSGPAQLGRCPFLDLAVEQPDVVRAGSGPCLVRLTEPRTKRRARGASLMPTEEQSP